MQDLVPLETSPNEHLKLQTFQHFIQAQAHVAYSKSNRNNRLEEEDFVAIGYEVFHKAKETWRSDKNTKFNTYFTLLLKNRLYKEMSKSHRKKRGGGGNKAEDLRFGRVKRWENGEAEADTKTLISIDSSEIEQGGAVLQIPAPINNSVEYDLLVQQVARHIPETHIRLYKQLVDPDSELLELAQHKVDSSIHPDKLDTKCSIDAKLMASYLKLDVVRMREMKRDIQVITAQQLNLKLKNKNDRYKSK